MNEKLIKQYLSPHIRQGYFHFFLIDEFIPDCPETKGLKFYTPQNKKKQTKTLKERRVEKGHPSFAAVGYYYFFNLKLITFLFAVKNF